MSQKLTRAGTSAMRNTNTGCISGSKLIVKYEIEKTVSPVKKGFFRFVFKYVLKGMGKFRKFVITDLMKEKKLDNNISMSPNTTTVLMFAMANTNRTMQIRTMTARTPRMKKRSIFRTNISAAITPSVKRNPAQNI